MPANRVCASYCRARATCPDGSGKERSGQIRTDRRGAKTNSSLAAPTTEPASRSERNRTRSRAKRHRTDRQSRSFAQIWPRHETRNGKGAAQCRRISRNRRASRFLRRSRRGKAAGCYPRRARRMSRPRRPFTFLILLHAPGLCGRQYAARPKAERHTCQFFSGWRSCRWRARPAPFVPHAPRRSRVADRRLVSRAIQKRSRSRWRESAM